MLSADDFKIGDVIVERYKLLEEIGRGGFGVVFRATQLGMDRDVAIKILKVDGTFDEKVRERFRREGRVVRNLNHPNTIRQYDFGETKNGVMFLVLEFLKGLNLVEAIRKNGALGDERTRRFAIGVLKSLSEAHAQGIVHRDLKPGNIMLCDVYGEKDYPKVLDFGIAKMVMGDESSSELTAAGIALGSPRYMAPEILRGLPPTPGSDVYSISITFAEAILGKPLFRSDSSVEAAKIQLEDAELPIPDRLKESSLWPWLSLGLKKDPDVRYSGAEEMLRFLDAPVGKLLARGAEVDSSKTSPLPAVSADLSVTNPMDAIEEITHPQEAHDHTPDIEYDPTAATTRLSAEDAQAAINAIIAEREALEQNASPQEYVDENHPTFIYDAIPDDESNAKTEMISTSDLPHLNTPPQEPKGSAPPIVKSSIFEPFQAIENPHLGPISLTTKTPDQTLTSVSTDEDKSSKKIIFIAIAMAFVGFILITGIFALSYFFTMDDTSKNDELTNNNMTALVNKTIANSDSEEHEEKPDKIVKLITFDLKSTPNAMLVIQGEKKGTTPLTFSIDSDKLPLKISLKKKGYEIYRTTLREQSKKIDAALLPKFKKSEGNSEKKSGKKSNKKSGKRSGKKKRKKPGSNRSGLPVFD